jgi:hypothetical protein
MNDNSRTDLALEGVSIITSDTERRVCTGGAYRRIRENPNKSIESIVASSRNYTGLGYLCS